MTTKVLEERVVEELGSASVIECETVVSCGDKGDVAIVVVVSVIVVVDFDVDVLLVVVEVVVVVVVITGSAICAR